jgi:hypothetical protein
MTGDSLITPMLVGASFPLNLLGVSVRSKSATKIVFDLFALLKKAAIRRLFIVADWSGGVFKRCLVGYEYINAIDELCGGFEAVAYLAKNALHKSGVFLIKLCLALDHTINTKA